jgi:hypothetical protein
VTFEPMEGDYLVRDDGFKRRIIRVTDEWLYLERSIRALAPMPYRRAWLDKPNCRYKIQRKQG